METLNQRQKENALKSIIYELCYNEFNFREALKEIDRFTTQKYSSEKYRKLIQHHYNALYYYTKNNIQNLLIQKQQYED